MRKKIIQFSTIVFIIAMSGCKKDVLQPNGWNKLWHKETTVMGQLNITHGNILKRIDDLRTTLVLYPMWDEDTMNVNGPGGYTAISEKAWRVWQASYEQTLMPGGDGNFSMSGDFTSIMKDYLDLRREYDRKKALKKMWLCIPKDLYEQDSRFWEWWLSKVGDYFTVTLGGPDAWTDGIRILSQEMEIYHLPTTPDSQDPWGCNCSAQTRITVWYLHDAEGPDKTDFLPSDFEAQMQTVRHNNAQKLHDRFLNVSDPNFEIGFVSDYETKLVTIGGAEYYRLAIPNVPTRD